MTDKFPCGHLRTPENCFDSRRGDGVRTRCKRCKQARERRRRKNMTPEQRARFNERLRKPPAALPVNDPRHGQPVGYNYWQCRCEPCREAGRDSGRLRRLRKLARDRGVADPVVRRQVRSVVSLDAVAEVRFGMDRVARRDAIWDDPTGDEAVGL